MKKFVLNLVFLGTFIVQAQNRVFYYDEWGGKIHLTKENGVKIIQFTNETSCLNHDFQDFGISRINNLANPENLNKILVQTNKKCIFAN